MSGQDISVPYNDSGIPSYLAEPASGSHVGVVLVSAIFGVDDDTKKMCDDLAASGYPTIAINMFWEDEQDNGPLPATPEGAERGKARGGRLDREAGNAYIGACVEKLKSLDSCNGKVAIFGFCFGGPFVLEAAAKFDLAGGISFHGSFVEKFLPVFDRVSCPLEFHYGDNDAIAPMAAIEQVKGACDKHADAKLYVYPGGEHGYMFPNRGPGFLEDGAKLSWQRAHDFLERINA